jgi:hypothetical protein
MEREINSILPYLNHHYLNTNRINFSGKNVENGKGLNLTQHKSYCLSQFLLCKGDISALSESCEDFIFFIHI